jgi:hypothetical protein
MQKLANYKNYFNLSSKYLTNIFCFIRANTQILVVKGVFRFKILNGGYIGVVSNIYLLPRYGTCLSMSLFRAFSAYSFACFTCLA